MNSVGDRGGGGPRGEWVFRMTIAARRGAWRMAPGDRGRGQPRRCASKNVRIRRHESSAEGWW